MSDKSTISQLLATAKDDAIAISAPGRASLTYKGLRQHVDKTIRALNRHGIERNDRVAIVLPNGGLSNVNGIVPKGRESAIYDVLT